VLASGMCTAYEIGKRGGSFAEHVKVAAFEYLMGLEAAIIRPTLPAPVVMPDGGVKTMLWGFRRPVPGGKTKQLWRTIVNSREDKLGGRTWSKAFKERRCLIPAAAFYEWIDGPRGKVPLKFESRGRGLMWIAGIWEEDKERGECFSMITTEPNAVVGPVHDRMPAVLMPGQIAPYLGGGLQEIGPSAVDLAYEEAANFLKRKEPPPQGELF
jgi:putative SOS response-associated peptidase YedK